ncbi:hypothetical protein [Piscirickettsia salmonis]|uniref:hypothetical protein n=1 Tax=Piscirickettsia salmonis TaxID=1238 RepID=UPI003A81339B
MNMNSLLSVALQMTEGVHFSDDFLAEYKEEVKRRSNKYGSNDLYHCQYNSLINRQKQKCLSVRKTIN